MTNTVLLLSHAVGHKNVCVCVCVITPSELWMRALFVAVRMMVLSVEKLSTRVWGSVSLLIAWVECSRLTIRACSLWSVDDCHLVMGTLGETSLNSEAPGLASTHSSVLAFSRFTAVFTRPAVTAF